jgi:hypothetical protein
MSMVRKSLAACHLHPGCASIGHARTYPPPVSRTSGLLARLFPRCSYRHDRAPYRLPSPRRPMELAMWLLSQVASGRISRRYRGELRPARADFEKAWRAFSAKRTPADYPGMARSMRLDGTQIRHVGTRREISVPDVGPMKYAADRPGSIPKSRPETLGDRQRDRGGPGRPHSYREDQRAVCSATAARRPNMALASPTLSKRAGCGSTGPALTEGHPGCLEDLLVKRAGR